MPEVSVEGFFLSEGGFDEDMSCRRDVDLSASDDRPEQAVSFACRDFVILIEVVAEDSSPSEIEFSRDDFEVHLITEIELIAFVRPIFDEDAIIFVVVSFVVVLLGVLAQEIEEEVIPFERAELTEAEVTDDFEAESIVSCWFWEEH